jgi:hypothetical protein
LDIGGRKCQEAGEHCIMGFTKYYLHYQIKEDDMDRECSMHVREKKCIQYFCWKPKDHSEDLGVGGKIIL